MQRSALSRRLQRGARMLLPVLPAMFSIKLHLAKTAAAAAAIHTIQMQCAITGRRARMAHVCRDERLMHLSRLPLAIAERERGGDAEAEAEAGERAHFRNGIAFVCARARARVVTHAHASTYLK